MRRPRRPETSDVPPARGRPFAKGNPGRKRGSQNRTTRAAAALLEGDVEELVRTAVDIAKAGNVVMLKFLLGPILPKGRPVRLSCPQQMVTLMPLTQWRQSSMPLLAGRSYRVKLQHLQALSRLMLAQMSLSLGRF